MTYRPLPTLAECRRRLRLVFPAQAFDTALHNDQAAWALMTMLYVDAVVPAAGALPIDAIWVRPSTVMWSQREVLARRDPASRTQWRQAALTGGKAKQQTKALVESWGIEFRPAYGDNSREGVRDETWPKWEGQGAARILPGVPTSSNRPRWALTAPFADLFDPGLAGGRLSDAIEAFTVQQVDPMHRVRAQVARQRDAQAHAVSVTLPDGQVRQLAPGDSSAILKGVIETWAPLRLSDPVVLTISEPGAKYLQADEQTMQSLGIHLDAKTLLPDALLVDIAPAPAVFWIVEAVATDGEINEDRKRRLEAWAQAQRIRPDACRFLSAFMSRNAGPAKRRLKDLAVDTYAWYLDEPTRELALYEIT